MSNAVCDPCAKAAASEVFLEEADMLRGKEMPLFRLADQGRGRYGTLDLWQRSEMVVALVHGSSCEHCLEVLRHLAAEGERLHRDQTEVLVLSTSELPQLEVLHVLVDDTGETIRRLEEAVGLPRGTPALLAADRFARMYGAEQIHLGTPDEVVARTLAWIDFAQSLCEECATPVEWA
jgi:hypothetical protein